MQTPTKASVWLFLITFALVFYGMGAASVESFVNYPTWPLIGVNVFRAYHRALGPLIVGYMVIPMLVATILTILLLWFRPASIPRWMVWLAIVLQLVVWISTVTIQLPIQGQLSADGLSLPLIEPATREQFLAPPSATHSQCISLLVDDVSSAAGKG